MKKDSICPKIIISYYLRWIPGRSYPKKEICAGISIKSFYRGNKKCFDEILACQDLFKNTHKEQSLASSEFNSRGMHTVNQGCVACIDGHIYQ
jgi:hypothetical protein